MEEKLQAQQKETDSIETSVQGIRVASHMSQELQAKLSQPRTRLTAILYVKCISVKVVVLAKTRECESKKHGTTINIKISLHHPNNTKTPEKEINELEK